MPQTQPIIQLRANKLDRNTRNHLIVYKQIGMGILETYEKYAQFNKYARF